MGNLEFHHVTECTSKNIDSAMVRIQHSNCRHPLNSVGTLEVQSLSCNKTRFSDIDKSGRLQA